ncbi:lytic transglycosylase domain-containing protein [Dyella jiangningensis]
MPPGVLAGLVQTESGGNPRATSNQGARGLTQIMPANDASLGVNNAYDPA